MTLELNPVKCVRVNLVMGEKESFWQKGQYIQRQIDEFEWI